MAKDESWIEEAWELLLSTIWDTREEGAEFVEYTKTHLEPILSRYTKSGQGEIRIFHSGSTKRRALKERGIVKIPITRASWRLVKGPPPIELSGPTESENFAPKFSLTEGMRAGIAETMLSKTNPGETTLLAIANHIGLIADFYDLKERGVLFTGGRQKAGVTLIQGNTEIDISKAQIEIDGGFEWAECAVVAEMKSSFKQVDFDSNQILIPLLKWQKLLPRKQVHALVLLAETNPEGIEYWAYDFSCKSNSGMELVLNKSKRYRVKIG